MNKVLIAPSILSADYLNFGRDIKEIEKAGADLLHVDVMDGVFVPNITFGMGLVGQIRQVTKLPLDVHLMIVEPGKYISRFAEAGADYITIHYEASKDLSRDLNAIRKNRVRPGVSINPDTSVKKIEPVLGLVELVLIMSVFPGFGGQEFISGSLSKIREVKEILQKLGSKAKIEVDGGLNSQTAPLALAAGADILVAGAAIFNAKNYGKAIKNLRSKEGGK